MPSVEVKHGPGRGRETAAGSIRGDGPRRVIAEPEAGHEGGGVADKPYVRTVVGSAGFSGDRSSEPPEGVAQCIALPLPVVPGDWRLRHKTTDRGFHQEAHAVARARGAHDAVFVRDDGLVTEGSYTNVFVERDGVLLTPPVTLGLLPGILRDELIEQGAAAEAELTLADLANGFFIGNALRGLIAARLMP